MQTSHNDTLVSVDTAWLQEATAHLGEQLVQLYILSASSFYLISPKPKHHLQDLILENGHTQLEEGSPSPELSVGI